MQHEKKKKIKKTKESHYCNIDAFSIHPFSSGPTQFIVIID